MFMAQETGFTAQKGIFVGVVGPSGAGKDTLIQLARERFAAEAGFLFPRRLVTRPPSAFEDHTELSEQEFTRGVRDGLFALHWRAHGLSYALDRAALAALEQGAVVTCNISRNSIGAAQQAFARIKIVLVTAPQTELATRLAGRGREAPADIAARLSRNAECAARFDPDITIVNSTSPAAAADELVTFLLGLRS